MIEFSEASISEIVLHKISSEEQNCFISDTTLELTGDEEKDTFKRVFLKSFQNISVTYEFNHEIDIELNTLLKVSKSIYDNKDFLKKSKSIYQHLKTVSKHPNIKDGDLFVVKFDELKLNNKYYEALGIYKIENKESFIETSINKSQKIDFAIKKGIGSKKLDKACLIVFTEESYTILIIDNNSIETDYWQNEFLKVKLRNDDTNNTNQFLKLTKTFLTSHLPSDFVVTKADQIDLLNRSVDYFKTHNNFEKKDFEQEVFRDNEVIESFRNFGSQYSQEKNIDIADDFSISAQAVKNQLRNFKNILKLDKNFHIYIHGNKELIEQGVEKDGRKFYKIYFEQEL